MKASTLCLLAVLTVGGGSRLFRLGHSLRVDEVEAWANSQRPVVQILADQQRLPHVSLLSHLSCRVLGDEEFVFRLPYALYGILSLPLLFLLGCRLYDEKVGALACLLLSVSVFHIQYSQEARYYAPLMFYSLSALYCLTAALGESEKGAWGRSATYWAGFGLSHLLALSLQHFALFPAALCGLFLLAVVLEAGRCRGHHGASAAMGLAAAVACAFVLAHQWSGLREFLAMESHPGRALPLRESYRLWHYRPLGASIVWEFLAAYSGGKTLGALFLTASAAGLIAAGRAHLRRSLALGLWIVLPMASLFVVRSRTHFELRYFCFLLPVWLLLTAAGMVDVTAALPISLRLRRGALALLSALVLCLHAGPLQAYYRLPKSRMREAFAHIGARALPGDAVVFYPAWDILWYGYYTLPAGSRLYHPGLLAESSPAYAPAEMVRGHERLWLAATWIQDVTRKRDFDGLKACVERYYDQVEEESFRARDPNDDYQVRLFRRKPGLRLPPPAPGRTASGTEIPRNPFSGKKIRFALNLHEAAERMEASRLAFFQALDNAALVRLGGSASGWPGEASRFCREGCGALVWSGKVRLAPTRTGREFGPGETFRLEPPGVAVHPSSDSLLVLFTAPQGSLRRLHGGARETDPRPREGLWQLVTGVVLSGQLHVEDGDKTHLMDFRAGDLYLYGRGPTERWTASNRLGQDSLELRMVENRSKVQAELTLSSSTGKAEGLWPPLLLQ